VKARPREDVGTGDDTAWPADLLLWETPPRPAGGRHEIRGPNGRRGRRCAWRSG